MDQPSPTPPPPQQPEAGPPPAGPGGPPPLSQMGLDFWLIAGGVLLAFIATFLPWYSVSSPLQDIDLPGFRVEVPSSVSINGLDVWQGVLGFILTIGVGVGAGLYYFSREMKRYSQPFAIGLTAGGGLITLFVFIRLLQGAGGASLGIGLFMALIGGVGILAGGIMLLMALQKSAPPA